MSVKVTKDNTDALVKAVRSLTSKELLIGIPATKGVDRQKEEGETLPLNNALLGYIHEFGEPDRNIPPRPVLVPGVESEMRRITKALEGAGKAALSGNLAAVDDGFAAAGLIAVAGVQNYITNADLAALSPVTLARRKAKGYISERPLVVTGQYRRSFKYVVTTKGK